MAKRPGRLPPPIPFPVRGVFSGWREPSDDDDTAVRCAEAEENER